MSILITFQRKKSFDTDLVNPLRSLIYANDGDPSDFSNECKTMDQLRQRAITAEENQAGLETVLKYCGQLELLELHFSNMKCKKMPTFTWEDAFTSESFTQHSFSYEKACMFFNLASICCSVAAAEDRSIQSGIKHAYNMMQASSGLLDYIKDNFLNPPSPDLQQSCLKTLSTLMLAQAQICFLEKCKLDNKRSSLTARIAMQAWYLFDKAVKFYKASENRFIRPETLNEVNVKMLYCKAMANYYQGLSDEEEEEYGVALARMTEAQSLANDIKKISMTACFEADFETLESKLHQLRKDNDFIFHQNVHSPTSEIVRLSAAKPTVLQDIFSHAEMQRIVGPDIFHKIVPFHVHESSSAYSEEKAKLVRSEASRVQHSNDEIDSTLDYFGLPNALDLFKKILHKDSKILSNTKSSSERRQKLEPLQPISDNIEDLGREIFKCISESTSTIQKLSSDHMATGDFIDLESLSESPTQIKIDFMKATNKAQALRTEILNNQAEFGLLLAYEGPASKNQQKTCSSDLLDLDPEQNIENFISSKVETIEEICSILSRLKRERNQIMQDIRKKVSEDDITDTLILNNRVTGNELETFQVELEKYQPLQLRVSATISQQIPCLLDLKNNLKSLMEHPEIHRRRQSWMDGNESSEEKGKERAMKTFGDLRIKLESETLNHENLLSRARSLVAKIREAESMSESVNASQGNFKSKGTVQTDQPRTNDFTVDRT